MSDGFELGPMTEDEDRMAVEAQIRTLCILHDALIKKRWLLAEPGRDYGTQAEKVPLIPPQLVEDLIQILQQVQLLKYNRTQNEAGVDTMYPVSSSVIGLCLEFWQKHENLSSNSRPGALIMAAACLLGYHDYDKIWMEESQGRSVPRATRISEAFEVWMRHKGDYIDGSYTCCGEALVHSVCEDSYMRFSLHSTLTEEQKELAEASIRATLRILNDAWDKELFIDYKRSIHLRRVNLICPQITDTLLADLRKTLQNVTFKCDSKPRNEALFAYPAAQNLIYLCPFFWMQNNRLGHGSRIGTLILCASQMLGYRHVLYCTSNSEEPTAYQEQGLLTADDICAAFESWMNHREPYREGSYSCCGENSEISVCRESIMALELRQYLEIPE
ncbi:uncharacterized protein [Dendropsophus ebraccatus]|uniref:uncharacterized protein n=1 Tax=Dendropsophus ebraccatus TaxID=150705 RepID=UPI00383162F4